MTEGCNEKLDWEFVKWILWIGDRKSKEIKTSFSCGGSSIDDKGVGD